MTEYRKKDPINKDPKENPINKDSQELQELLHRKKLWYFGGDIR